MFNVQRIPGDLEVLELTDTDANSRVLLAPARGGMATRFRIGNREIFYLDEATLSDVTANVRGGNPVLFPSPGQLENKRYRVGEAGQEITGELGQHGFARQLPWTLGDMNHVGGASATLHLASSEATRPNWPWEFELALTYTLVATKLRIDVRLTNTDSKPMPFAFGFHPYFSIPEDEKPGARVETRASRAWDNVQKKEVKLDRIALGGREVDLHLHDHDSTRSSLSYGDNRFSIEGSAEFTRWVVWTLPNKSFVCVEPWTAPFNALNTGEGLRTLAPGDSAAMFVSYTGDVKQDKVPRPPREYGT